METSLALSPGDSVFLEVIAAAYVYFAASTGNLIDALVILFVGPVLILIGAFRAFDVCSECECQNWLIIGYSFFGVFLMIEGLPVAGTAEIASGLVSLTVWQLCGANIGVTKTLAWDTALQDLVLAAWSSMGVTNILKNAFAVHSA